MKVSRPGGSDRPTPHIAIPVVRVDPEATTPGIEHEDGRDRVTVDPEDGTRRRVIDRLPREVRSWEKRGRHSRGLAEPPDQGRCPGLVPGRTGDRHESEEADPRLAQAIGIPVQDTGPKEPHPHTRVPGEARGFGCRLVPGRERVPRAVGCQAQPARLPGHDPLHDGEPVGDDKPEETGDWGRDGLGQALMVDDRLGWGRQVHARHWRSMELTELRRVSCAEGPGRDRDLASGTSAELARVADRDACDGRCRAAHLRSVETASRHLRRSATTGTPTGEGIRHGAPPRQGTDDRAACARRRAPPRTRPVQFTNIHCGDISEKGEILPFAVRRRMANFYR